MAGIVINASASWLVAGWVHDFTRSLLLKHLPEEGYPELKRLLLVDAETRLGFFSLEGLDKESVSFLKIAVGKIADELHLGKEPFETPEMLSAYLDRLNELRMLLARDQRDD